MEHMGEEPVKAIKEQLEPTAATESIDENKLVPGVPMDLREQALFLIGQIQGVALVHIAEKYDSSDTRLGRALLEIASDLKAVVLDMALEVDHVINLDEDLKTDESP
jgi:hypothetical protein